MSSVGLEPKGTWAESSPSLVKNTDKLARTFVDFFAAGKADSMKAPLSVNVFQLKLKQHAGGCSALPQSVKKVHFDCAPKYPLLANPKNNLLLTLSEQQHTTRDFFPSLTKNQCASLEKNKNHHREVDCPIASPKRNFNAFLGKKTTSFKDSIIKRKEVGIRVEELASECTDGPPDIPQQTDQKTYFINNLSLGLNFSERRGDSKTLPKFVSLTDEVEGWKKFVSEQGAKKHSKREKNLEKISEAGKDRKTRASPQVPDPLKTYRLSLNPEELSAKIRRKFKVNLVKRAPNAEQGDQEDSEIEGWQTQQEDGPWSTNLTEARY